MAALCHPAPTVRRDLTTVSPGFPRPDRSRDQTGRASTPPQGAKRPICRIRAGAPTPLHRLCPATRVSVSHPSRLVRWVAHRYTSQLDDLVKHAAYVTSDTAVDILQSADACPRPAVVHPPTRVFCQRSAVAYPSDARPRMSRSRLVTFASAPCPRRRSPTYSDRTSLPTPGCSARIRCAAKHPAVGVRRRFSRGAG